MNILFTNHGLRLRGGTELFTAEIARAMLDRGHQVAVYTTVDGPVGESLRNQGIPVLTAPRDCPFSPEIIHGQHHLQALTALCEWPEVPGVFMMHGIAPWEELPPVHPRLRRYLANSPHFGWWLEQQCGISRDQLEVVPNGFDSRRFSRVRPATDRSGKALVFHNSIRPQSPAWNALRDACEASGLSLHGIGREFGEMIDDPEHHLPDYDLVFASGRCALEAIACGCAVIPVSADTMAARVHPGILDALVDLNFCPDPSHRPIQAGRLRMEIESIRPEETAAVTERIRQDHSTESVAERLLEIYRSVVETGFDPDPTSELMALGKYLGSLAERVAGVDARRAEWLTDKIRAGERAERWRVRAGRAENRLNWLESRMNAAAWWHRRYWRKLRRAWEAKGEDEKNV